MPSLHADLDVQQLPAATVIAFLDRRLIDPVHVERIGEQLKDIVKSLPKPRIVLSFEKVEYFSSAALTVLIDLEKTIRKRGGQLRLANLDEEINKLFVLMKLHKVMSIHSTTAEALASL